MIWHDIELADDIVAKMLELGLAERIECIRTTPLFDDLLRTEILDLPIGVPQPSVGVPKE